ncbi:MAG: hypothetical protein GC150_03410 [Rhizobiales bacterium]|nr:hypothetical protein [Hyphomicrobiales bacterium]
MARRVSQDRLNTALGVNRGVPAVLRASSPPARDEEDDGGGAIDQIVGVLFGIAGIAFAGFLLYEGISMAGLRQQTASEMARIRAVTDPQASPLYRDADRSILSACFGAEPDSGNQRSALVERDAAVGQYASFLVCAMQMQRDRLCDGKARGQLVEQIDRYRQVRYDLAELHNSHLTAAGVRVAMNTGDLLADVSGTMNGQGTGTTVAQFQRVPEVRNDRFDARVGFQLEDLVRSGYLDRSDFAGVFGGVSGEIARFVEVPPSGRQPCG